MSDEQNQPDNTQEAAPETGDTTEKAEGGKSYKFLFISLFLLLLVVGIGGGLWFSGAFDSTDTNAEETPEGEEPSQVPAAEEGEENTQIGGVFYPLPEMMVNLASNSRRSSFLKVTINLELDDAKDIPAIEKILPRITDDFQVYLRELRPQDLKGSAGIHRLREELLTRLRLSSNQVPVRDILFKEILVQ